MSKWIQTDKGEYINADHIQTIGLQYSEVIVTIVNQDQYVILAVFENPTQAKQCIDQVIAQLRDSKEVTIKATVEEK